MYPKIVFGGAKWKQTISLGYIIEFELLTDSVWYARVKNLLIFLTLLTIGLK